MKRGPSTIMRLVVLGVAAASIAASCATDTSTITAADLAGDQTAQPPGEYPSFVASTSDGTTFEMASYAGQDVILWFWAPW